MNTGIFELRLLTADGVATGGNFLLLRTADSGMVEIVARRHGAGRKGGKAAEESLGFLPLDTLQRCVAAMGLLLPHQDQL
jgi:hypothetical protein